MINFEYYAPSSLEEALSLLDNQQDRAKVLAGGTDLIVQMKDKRVQPALIVDVKKIPELNRLEWQEETGLHIGAAVPLSQVVAFSPVVERFSLLAQACSLIGSTQIRNRGTVGGNICNASPSADTVPSLLCLGARAVVARPGETRVIPLENFFRGPGETVLAANELLVEIEIPTPPASSAGCYLRHTPREDMDLAVVGVASFLTLAARSNVCQEAKIALGAVAPTAVRANEAERLLTGKVLGIEIITEAAERAAKAARPISDVRASAEYRVELVKILTRRALKRGSEILGISI